MTDLKNFKSTAQRHTFFQILKRFGRDFIFIGLVIFAALWMMGTVGTHQKHFACGAENVRLKNKENYFYKDGNYFKNGNAQSNDFALEGKSSLKLDKENPFGFGFDYEYLEGNEEVLVWGWRYAEGDWISNGKIVISINGKLWKAAEEVVERKDSGWEKIQIQFNVPNFSKNEILQFYCWNPGGRPVYFDDFHVVIRELEQL